MRSAPLFQLLMIPSRDLETMASSEDSTIAANRACVTARISSLDFSAIAGAAETDYTLTAWALRSICRHRTRVRARYRSISDNQIGSANRPRENGCVIEPAYGIF